MATTTRPRGLDLGEHDRRPDHGGRTQARRGGAHPGHPHHGRRRDLPRRRWRHLGRRLLEPQGRADHRLARRRALRWRSVDTPWEAFSQASIIKHHTLVATGGQTYAEVSTAAKALGDKLTAEGVSAADQAANPDLAKLNGLKTVVMNGSFLRASLFTSVVAFGVAALVMGLGVVFGIVGYAITRPQGRRSGRVISRR